MDLLRFLCWRVTLLLVLSKAFCCVRHHNEPCLKNSSETQEGGKRFSNIPPLCLFTVSCVEDKSAAAFSVP